MVAGTAAGAGPADVYGDLAAVDRDWLRRAAGELRAKLRRTVEEVVASGRLLAQARRRLGRAQWRPWLAAEAQIPPRSAVRLVNVGTVFGSLTDTTLAHFTPTALYALAEPGVPQAIRELAVATARDGEDVTAGKVAEWVGLSRETVESRTKAEERALLKLAPDDDADPADDYHDPAEVFAADNWRLLRDLVGAAGTVHIAGTPDAESEDGLYHAFAIDAAGRRTHAEGGTVEACVLKLAGGVRKKVCPKCGENKPLDAYCVRTDMPDGREYRCKRCEAARVKAHTAAKTAERAGAARRAAG
jgi:hypothetical protein